MRTWNNHILEGVSKTYCGSNVKESVVCPVEKKDFNGICKECAKVFKSYLTRSRINLKLISQGWTLSYYRGTYRLSRRGIQTKLVSDRSIVFLTYEGYLNSDYTLTEKGKQHLKEYYHARF